MPLAPRVRRLDSNHDVVWGSGSSGQGSFASGSESTAQRVRTALLEIQGEWFMDVTAGVPWYPIGDDPSVVPIMGGSGAPDLGYAEAVIKARILSVDGVASIESFSVVFDHGTRKLAVTASGTDVDGGVFAFPIQDPGP